MLLKHSNLYLCEFLTDCLNMRIFAYICLVFIVAAPMVSYAGEPLEDLRQGIDEGIRILEDPRYEDASLRKIQQQKLWEVTLKIFDFREFSRRVLASHWVFLKNQRCGRRVPSRRSIERGVFGARCRNQSSN